MKIPTDKQQITTNKPQINDDKSMELIALIVENPNYTIQQIADKLQISVASTRTYIERLKRENGLARVGSRKTGHWEFRHA